MPPDVPADILLLGCDLKMNITCCDSQKAVIARHKLLLSLIIDHNDGQVLNEPKGVELLRFKHRFESVIKEHYWKYGSTELNADIRKAAKHPNPALLAIDREAIIYDSNDTLLGFYRALAYVTLRPDDPVSQRIHRLPLLKRVVTVARMECNGPDYTTPVAPLDFDVIDTSNLCDYIGPLVLLTTASPLLRNHAASILYTEVWVKNNETYKDLFPHTYQTTLHHSYQAMLHHMLCGHVLFLSTLLDLFSIEYWANTSSTSLGDEMMLATTTEGLRQQMFLRASWKRAVHDIFGTMSQTDPNPV
ncbi:hypothetical protein CIB48_g93 [Xylaria polymorpha]|nr:hypothetical protein CIB48_g93 [Xylaria polymorpha]